MVKISYVDTKKTFCLYFSVSYKKSDTTFWETNFHMFLCSLSRQTTTKCIRVLRKWQNKMTLRVKVLVSKPDDLNSIPRTHMAGENQLLQDVPWPSYAHTYTHTLAPYFHRLAYLKMCPKSLEEPCEICDRQLFD